MVSEFQVGDSVCKNPETWVPNEFDSWGRGVCNGLVVKSPVPIDDLGAVDVQWPHGRCWEDVEGLVLVPKKVIDGRDFKADRHMVDGELLWFVEDGNGEIWKGTELRWVPHGNVELTLAGDGNDHAT